LGEVGLLFLTVVATVLLIGGGIFVPLLLTQAAGSSSSYFAPKAGAAMGFLVSALLWRKLLNYYRYEAHTLRPIKEDETNDRDAH